MRAAIFFLSAAIYATPLASLTFPDLSVRCAKSAFYQGEYHGVCASEHVYIEWRTGGSLRWLREGRDEVINRLLSYEGIPAGMFSNLDLLPPSFYGSYAEDELWLLDKRNADFCQLSETVPMAASVDYPFYKNEFSDHLLLITFFPLTTEELRFFDATSRRVARCFLVSPGSTPSLTVDFFPISDNTSDADLEVLVRAFLFDSGGLY